MGMLTGIAFGGQIAAAARRHGVDPDLLAAVAAQETGGPGSGSGRNVVGDHGHGHGLFQIDDRFHAFAKSASAMDPAKNADYAASMLSGLLKRYGGDVHQALSAYNAGSPTAQGTVTNWGGGVKLGYADSVMRHYAQLTDSATPASVSAAATPASATAVSGTSQSSTATWDQLAAVLAAQSQSISIGTYTPPPPTRRPDQSAQEPSPPASSVLEDLSDDS